MKVVNIVLSGKFSGSVDFSSLPDCIYRPARFSGAVKSHGGCTFLLFSNGSFVCLGSKLKRKGIEAVESMASALNLHVLSCSPKNIVMSHKLGHCVNMRGFYESLRKMGRSVTYEDELFNGIVWKEDGATVRLFHTGSFFVTGLSSVSRLKNVCRSVCVLCKTYKK